MERLERAVQAVKAALPDLTLLEHEPLHAHSSFHIGGEARVLALPADGESFCALCALLHEQGLRPFVLGNGSNLLFPDEGLPLAFLVGAERLQELRLLPDGAVYAGAGVSLSRLAAFACENKLDGLVFASGIPGSVGGGVRMNAGAYGGELKDAVERVYAWDLQEQRLREFAGGDCGFGYRRSVFQSGRWAILGARFRLRPGAREEIAAAMRELGEKRREKQPLELPSAGSAFKRPEGYFAAALIDQAGLKGLRVGGAQVSEKHAGFIVNAGGASARDVRALMAQVQETVFARFGVRLEPEIIALEPSLSSEID